MCGIMMAPEAWDSHAPASRMTIGEAMAHAGAPEETGQAQNAALTPDAFAEWLRRDCFCDSMWVNCNGGARCTACGSYLRAEALEHMRHRGEIRCPACGKTVTLRLKRYGHKRLMDEFYAIRWRKSAIEPGALVMIGYYCALDERGPMPELAEKMIVPVLIDVFRYGGGAIRYMRSVRSYDAPAGEAHWGAMREVRAIGSNYFKHRVDVERYPDSFEDAIAGTPFAGALECIRKASMREMGYMDADKTDRSELMDAIARRPWIEYMIKAGFSKVALAALNRTPRGTLNPRGRCTREILMLSTDRYAEMRGMRANPRIRTLRIVQRLDGFGVRAKYREIEEIDRRLGWRDWSDVEQAYGSPDRALIRYILRLPDHGMATLMDYWQLARNAGIALDTQEARLPRDLEQAHDRAVRANAAARARGGMSEEREAELAKKLEARMPELERRYTFAHAGLVLRPARSFAELINEGNALCHCVASYFTSYATGRTDICLLRRADAPDVSWRTVEINPVTGARIQDRGYRNDYARGQARTTMTPELRAELDEFWAAFDRWREDCMIADAMEGDDEDWKRAG